VLDYHDLAILAGYITNMAFASTIRTSSEVICEVQQESNKSSQKYYLLSTDFGFFKSYLGRRNFWHAVNITTKNQETEISNDAGKQLSKRNK